MRTISARIVGLLLCLVLSVAVFAQDAPPADLDAYVARAMKTFEVPGLALAIVKDGKVVLAKGYGVRKLGDPAPVDENTLFGIASNSKAFTAAALAMLVDEGKLSWDDPVTKYLPSFHLYDPYVSRELMVRDLLCHRSGLGLGAGDLLFWPDTDFKRADVLAAAGNIRPATSLRSRYAYNNLAFVVAGELVPAVTGKSWDDFVRERIFTPLGMTSTRITTTGLKPGDNIAYQHSKGWRLQGELKPIAFNRDEIWAAAAGIKSSVNDLSKWVLAQLNGGKLPDGKRLWSEAQANEMWSAQFALPTGRATTGPLAALRPNFSAYGLGWSLRDYRGRKIVSHGGALTGMVSTVVLVPEEKLGIIVLTNQEEGGAYSSISYHILDHYLKTATAADWIAAFRASRDQSLARAAEAEKKQAAARAANSRPSLELAKYAGEYTDAWYGKVTIENHDGKLVLKFTHTPSLVADLEHWNYDTFRAVFRDNTVPDAFLTFTLKPDGNIEQMKMIPTSSLADFSFDYQDLLFKPVTKTKSD